jgi:hypothetical protein
MIQNGQTTAVILPSTFSITDPAPGIHKSLSVTFVDGKTITIPFVDGLTIPLSESGLSSLSGATILTP